MKSSISSLLAVALLIPASQPVCLRDAALAQQQEPKIRIGTAEVALYRTETGSYRDNLASGAPSLWVALRPTGVEPPYEIVAVTADPAEGVSA